MAIGSRIKIEMSAIQLKLARTALGMTVREAAELADVSHDTVVAIETAKPSVKPKTIQKVWNAFEKAGIVFITESNGWCGIRFNAARQRKKR